MGEHVEVILEDGIYGNNLEEAWNAIRETQLKVLC